MSLIASSDRFAIFGASGMAGSAISRALLRSGYFQQLKPSRMEVDLLNLWRCSSGSANTSRR